MRDFFNGFAKEKSTVTATVAVLAVLMVVSENAHAVSCNSSSTGFTNANAAQGAYSFSPLGMAHMLLTFVNDGYGNIPADMMCHFTNDMGMPTSGITLPFSATKTFNGHTIVLKVTSPNEAFAVANAYTAKAVITYDGVVYMNMWWGGSGTNAIGFISIHSNGFDPSHATYIQFDLSSPTAQTLKIESAAGNLTSNGDMSMYGRFVFNSVTNAVSGHMLGVMRAGGVNTCYRAVLSAGSVLGSNLTISYDVGGGLTSAAGAWSTTDSTGFTSKSAVDAVGTMSGSAANPAIALDYSCANVAAFVSGGNHLAAGDVSDALNTTDIFPH